MRIIANKEYCEICGEKFNLFRWRNICDYCGKTVCADCCKSVNGLNYRFCKNCREKVIQGIDNIIIVKSSHIGSYHIKKKLPKVFSTNSFRDKQDAVNDIRYQAFVLKANAIINLVFRTQRDSENAPSKIDWYTNQSGIKPVVRDGGTHFFNVFEAEGIPVVIEKNKLSKKKSFPKKSISSEIKELLKLKQQGVLTEDEFKQAKKRLLK